MHQTQFVRLTEIVESGPAVRAEPVSPVPIGVARGSDLTVEVSLVDAALAPFALAADDSAVLVISPAANADTPAHELAGVRLTPNSLRFHVDHLVTRTLIVGRYWWSVWVRRAGELYQVVPTSRMVVLPAIQASFAVVPPPDPDPDPEEDDNMPGIQGLPGHAGSVAEPDIISPTIALPANTTTPAALFGWPQDTSENALRSVGVRVAYWTADGAVAGVVELVAVVRVLSGAVSLVGDVALQGTLPSGWTATLAVVGSQLRVLVSAGAAATLWTVRAWLGDIIELGAAGVAPLPAAVAPTVAITSPSAGWSTPRGLWLFVGGTYERGTGTPERVEILDGIGLVVANGVIAGDGTWGAHVWLVSQSGAYSLRARITDSLGRVVTSAAVAGTIATSTWTPPADTAPPVMGAFASPTYSSTLAITLATAPSATDAVGVTGYLVSVDELTAPLAADVRWGAAPTVVTVGTEGSHTLRAFARDAAGNISAAASSTTTVDTTAPAITAFAAPADATSTTLTLTTPPAATGGSSGIRGYIVTVNSTTVPTSASTWGAAPTTVELPGSGTHTLRAYACSNAGLVSPASIVTTTFASADTTAPVVNAFAAPAYASALTFALTTPPAATDDTAVTGYLVTIDTATAPTAGAGGWGAAPSQITVGAQGSHTLRAYARDAAGNVSAPVADTIIVDTTAPAVTFVAPATSDAFSIAITTLTAAFGASGGNGFIVTVDDATAPLANDVRWGAAPTTATVAADGTHTLRAYARSNAGLVSAAVSQSVVVTNVAVTYFSDNFARADGAVGNSWQQFGAAAGVVASNTMRRSDGQQYAYGVLAHASGAPSGDYWFHAEFSNPVLPPGSNLFGIVVRGNADLTQAIRFFWVFGRNATDMTVRAAADGEASGATLTFTTINPLPSSWANNVNHTVDVHCAGNTISLYCDGVLHGTVTSSQQATAANTLVGVCGTAVVTGVAFWDNIVVGGEQYA